MNSAVCRRELCSDAPDRPSAPRVCPREAWPCRYRQAASRGGRNASPRRCASFTASFLRSARSLSTASIAAPAACQLQGAQQQAQPSLIWMLAASAGGVSSCDPLHASRVSDEHTTQASMRGGKPPHAVRLGQDLGFVALIPFVSGHPTWPGRPARGRRRPAAPPRAATGAAPARAPAPAAPSRTRPPARAPRLAPSTRVNTPAEQDKQRQSHLYQCCLPLPLRYQFYKQLRPCCMCTLC